jgi:hypothetical protein
MLEFYLYGLGLGILISLHTLVCFKYGAQTKKIGLRLLWGGSHAVMLILVVILSIYILSTYFPEIQSKYKRVEFILLWLLPYAITGLWFLWPILGKKD